MIAAGGALRLRALHRERCDRELVTSRKPLVYIPSVEPNVEWGRATARRNAWALKRGRVGCKGKGQPRGRAEAGSVVLEGWIGWPLIPQSRVLHGVGGCGRCRELDPQGPRREDKQGLTVRS